MAHLYNATHTAPTLLGIKMAAMIAQAQIEELAEQLKNGMANISKTLEQQAEADKLIIKMIEEIVDAHDGDSDDTSDSDKVSEDEHENQTAKSIKMLKKKYKKLKKSKKRFKRKKAQFQKHYTDLKAKLDARNKRIKELVAKLDDEDDSSSSSSSSDVSD